jgi:hypothetical protein
MAAERHRIMRCVRSDSERGDRLLKLLLLLLALAARLAAPFERCRVIAVSRVEGTVSQFAKMR